MKFELIKDEELSGEECSIYQIFWDDDALTLYAQFFENNYEEFKDEIKDIDDKLYTIGHETGGRSGYFKEEESRRYNHVCALYDNPNSKLRLYCIKYGMDLVILGSGGHKPNSVRTYQEIEILDKNVKILEYVANQIYKRREGDDLRFVNFGKDFEGNLIFDDEEE